MNLTGLCERVGWGQDQRYLTRVHRLRRYLPRETRPAPQGSGVKADYPEIMVDLCRFYQFTLNAGAIRPGSGHNMLEPAFHYAGQHGWRESFQVRVGDIQIRFPGPPHLTDQ